MVEVDMIQAELLSETSFPLKAVHQAPGDVSFDIRAVLDRPVDCCQIRVQILDTLRVVQSACENVSVRTETSMKPELAHLCR